MYKLQIDKQTYNHSFISITLYRQSSFYISLINTYSSSISLLSLFYNKGIVISCIHNTHQYHGAKIIYNTSKDGHRITIIEL